MNAWRSLSISNVQQNGMEGANESNKRKIQKKIVMLAAAIQIYEIAYSR